MAAIAFRDSSASKRRRAWRHAPPPAAPLRVRPFGPPPCRDTKTAYAVHESRYAAHERFRESLPRRRFVSVRVGPWARFRVAGIRRGPKVEKAQKRMAKADASGIWDEKAFKPMRVCAFSSGEAARLMSRVSWSRVAHMYVLERKRNAIREELSGKSP